MNEARSRWRPENDMAGILSFTGPNVSALVGKLITGKQLD
jgi:hypothetical protein